MNDAQVWTIIGVLGATVVGMVAFGFTMMLRTMRAEMSAMRAEVGGMRSDIVGATMAAIAELRGEMQTGFARVETRLDAMDRDVNALMRHTFGIDRE